MLAARYLENSCFSSFLNLVRWTAALIVVIGHCRGLMFYGWGDVPSDERTLVVFPWYFISGLFNEAVMVFFVLSGYLIASTVTQDRRSTDFVVRKFFIDRYSRLYVGVIPALIFTAILDGLGNTFLYQGGFYNGSNENLVRNLAGYNAFEASFNVPDFLGSLLMLQGIFFTPFGSNPPLWSIAYEFWFYTVFGLSLAVQHSSLGHHYSVRMLPLTVGLGGLLYLFLGSLFAVYFGIWLLGVFAAYWRPFDSKWLIPSFLLFLFCLAFFRLLGDVSSISYYNVLKNYCTACSFLLVLNSMKTFRSTWLLNSKNLNARLAGFSFSVYLIHYPLLIFILSGLATLFPSLNIVKGFYPSELFGISLYVVVICSTIGVAWIFAHFTEHKTDVLRRFLYQKIFVTLSK